MSNEIEFFTLTSIGSAAIASAAVNIVTNTLYRLVKVNQKWTAFITGLFIAYLAVALKPSPHWAEWILAFLNGCLLFLTAMGMNDFLEAHPERRQRFMPDLQEEQQTLVEREPFFSSWHK